MKKIMYRLITILVIGILGVMVCMIPVVKRGYDMYETAMKQESLQKRIKAVRTRDDYVRFDQISPRYIKALLDSEDQRFYDHDGIDYIAIARAIFTDIKAGRLVQGGSTITQQLAKNLCFSFDKRFERKIAEIFVARELEATLTKQEILELYCNIIYFGNGCYGIKKACNYYYGIEPKDLSASQSTVLAKTIKSPSKFNPKAEMCYGR